MAEQKRRRVTLVTGFPQFTTRRLVERIARTEPTTSVSLLVPERAMAQARSFVESLPGRKTRYEILQGDVRRIDLGLSGEEWKKLASTVTVIHHLAAVFHLGVARKTAEEVNIQGTAEVLELARAAKRLERLVFYSTVGVAGSFKGPWREEDLDRGQSFKNHYEETKFRAEKMLLRDGAGLPVTVLRSSVLVGDSKTGEVDRFDGPYQLMMLLVVLPVDLGKLLPGRAARLINFIPVDFFVDASLALADHPEAAGRTFHIVDPSPLPLSEVFNVVAVAARRQVPAGRISAQLTRTLMRTPGLEGFADSPMAALDLFSSDASIDASKAHRILRAADVRCPPFPDYVDNLVAFMREKMEAEASLGREEEVYDPLW